MNKLILFTFIVFFSTASCLAEVIQSKTNEPNNSLVGMRIDLDGKEFSPKVWVNDAKYLLINKADSDVKIKKDNKTNSNHYEALISYNLYSNGKKYVNPGYLYLQCPIKRRIYIDRSKEIKPGVIKVEIDTIREEIIDPGYYKFLYDSNAKDTFEEIKKSNPTSGKPYDDYFNMEILCLQFELIAAKYEYLDAIRDVILNKSDILK